MVDFNEEKHEYKINGVLYPSVTEICNPISFEKLDCLAKSVLDRARARGTAVHEYIENYIYTNEFDYCEIPNEYLPYCYGFENWWKTYKPKPLYSELILGNSDLGYCGTCDFVCKIDNEICLVDFKATSIIDYKSLSVQLEGYRQLLGKKGIFPKRFYVLHLKKDQKWTFKEIIIDNEWWELLKQHNKKMRGKERLWK